MDILFGVGLHRYGIDTHVGRNTGRLALAAELPASVLADLTGISISISTAERWSQWAKRDWALESFAAADLSALRAVGPARKVSVSMPEDLTAAVQLRVGRGKFSQYVTEAVTRQLELDLLDELSELLTAEHG